MAQSTRSKGKTTTGAKKAVAAWKKYRQSEFRKNGGVSNFLAGDYVCPICHEMVFNRNRRRHEKDHKIKGQTPTRLPNQHVKPGPTLPPPPAPPAPVAKPSRVKTGTRGRRTAPEPTAPKPQPAARPTQGDPSMPSVLRTATRAFTRWSTQEPADVEEARADLAELATALIALSEALNKKVETLAAAQWPTTVLTPLREIGDQLGSSGPLAAQAYAELLKAHRNADDLTGTPVGKQKGA